MGVLLYTYLLLGEHDPVRCTLRNKHSHSLNNK